MTDKKRQLGDAYELALRVLKAHIGDCVRCAWIGDFCTERESRLDDLLDARRALRKEVWRLEHRERRAHHRQLDRQS